MGHVIAVGTGLPLEPEVGTVVELIVSFDGADPTREYRYVMVRVPHGNWYVTGQAGEHSWRGVWRNLEGGYLRRARRLDTVEELAW